MMNLRLLPRPFSMHFTHFLTHSSSSSSSSSSSVLHHHSLISTCQFRKKLCSHTFKALTEGLSHRRPFCVCASSVKHEAPVQEEEKKECIPSLVGAFRKRLRIADIKSEARIGEHMTVRGWIRTCRIQKAFAFLEVNDGSCLFNLQCVINLDIEGYEKIESGIITTGASVAVDGMLVKSEGTKQKIELKATKLSLIGASDAATYPVQKKKLSREFLRTIAHMRPRTNTFGAVARIRNALAFATHQFFQERGFIWVASPIITASDCEGAGEQFCVTTLISHSTSPEQIPTVEKGEIDWSQDFFGKPAYLTVSGQLNAESYATALYDVNTFGPTFRAENSNTSRHLAEFWVIDDSIFWCQNLIGFTFLYNVSLHLR